MSNREKYDHVFMNCFQIEKDKLNEALVYQSITTWDSVGHMAMIAALEESFDIMIDTEDVIDFSSYLKGIDILAKYQVVLC
jgi:acyl carrier protein